MCFPRAGCVSYHHSSYHSILDNLKEAHQSALFASDGIHSTVKFYNSLQLKYMCAAYLSSLQSFDSTYLAGSDVAVMGTLAAGLQSNSVERIECVKFVTHWQWRMDSTFFLLRCPAYEHIR